jgi:hypothetical protein
LSLPQFWCRERLYVSYHSERRCRWRCGRQRNFDLRIGRDAPNDNSAAESVEVVAEGTAECTIAFTGNLKLS